jgi:hypothetical protein
MSIALATVLLGVSSTAHADPVYYGAYVHGFINNEGCGRYGDGATFIWGNSANCMFSGTDPRFFAPNFYGPVPYVPASWATATHGDIDESISALASLATGDLSVQLSSSPTAWYSSVSAVMWETLTFQFADSASHLISVTMSGENYGTPNTIYKLELFQPPDPDFHPQTLTMAQGVMGLPTGPYSVSTSMLVTNGMQVVLLAGIGMAGEGGSTGIAWDPLSLSLDGGTFTSASGVFLTQSVPEPAALLLLAVAGGAAALRRRTPSEF